MMTRTWLDLPDRPLSRDSSQAAERERAKTTGSSEEEKDAGSHYNAKTDDWPVAGGSFLEHSQYFSASSLLTVSSRTGVLTYIQPSHLPPFQPHRHDLTQRWQISQTWKKREAGCHKPSNYGGGGRRDVVVCSLLCVCVCVLGGEVGSTGTADECLIGLLCLLSEVLHRWKKLNSPEPEVVWCWLNYTFTFWPRSLLSRSFRSSCHYACHSHRGKEKQDKTPPSWIDKGLPALNGLWGAGLLSMMGSNQ